MFLVNSRPGSFTAASTHLINQERKRSLSRSYGCYFAEFLNASSPVHLSLLDSTTGVGLRYGQKYFSPTKLFWSARVTQLTFPRGKAFDITLRLRSRIYLRSSTPTRLYPNSLTGLSCRTASFRGSLPCCALRLERVPKDPNSVPPPTSSCWTKYFWFRNINRISIDYGFRPRLRTDSPHVDCHCVGNLGLAV